jgi:pyruvate dehydrogenase E1 component alpha subunit
VARSKSAPSTDDAAPGAVLALLDCAGKLLPGAKPPIPDARTADLYRHMVRTRRFDARLLKLQRQGRIGTFAPCLGQEAAQVGSIAALTPKDWFVPSFRELAAALYRGAPMRSVLLYAMGLEEGSVTPPEARDLPISIPVGGQTAHAVGLAWAMKLKGDPGISLCYFGDGATSEGIVHESMNFAGVLRLPTIFFCQNNQWAISTPRRQQTAGTTIAQRAAAYGFPGVQVDGNDILAVHQVTLEAARRAREGGGATLIEAITYRRGVHTTADDPRVYRSEAEEKEWEAKDPVDRVRAYLESRGAWDAKRQEALEAAVDAEIQEAVDAAEAYRATEVDPLEMFDFVYRTMPPELRRQREEAARVFEGRNIVVGASQPKKGPGGAAAVGELEEAAEEKS